MGRANIDVGFRRHARVPDAVRAPEAAKPVLLGDHRRIAKVFDQLESRAERQDFGPLDLFDLGGKPPRIAGVAQAIAEGVRRGFGDLDRLRPELGEAPIDLGLALPDLRPDAVVFRHVLLLGELEAHDIFVGTEAP